MPWRSRRPPRRPPRPTRRPPPAETRPPPTAPNTTCSTTTPACAPSARSPRRSASVEQKKSVLYFSGGMTRSGGDNQVELRAAIEHSGARQRGALSGGHARAAGRRARRRCIARKHGRRCGVLGPRCESAVRSSCSRRRRRSRHWHPTRADVPLRTPTIFGDAFAQVQRDTSLYYLLGYSSTNDHEGRPLPAHHRCA